MRKLKSFCIILIILISLSVTNFAILLGDIDLDGEITITDLAKLKLHLIGSKVIEGEGLKTADLDGDGEITINDLARLKLILIETEDLKCVNNIEELKQSNAKLGDKYKTLGYYLANDGGNGEYEIIQKTDENTIDNGLFIELNNGLVAKLITENKTANVKQFGAKGDGKTDDSKAIETALNSKIENLDFPKADYKITNFISLNNGGVAVSGNDSVIFTDNDYKPSKYSEFLFIVNGEDYTFTNLNFEARETKNVKDLYSAQIYVGGTNIEFDACDFIIPETTSSEHNYNNLDLYTGWHNVKIENCNLYLANDSTAGGCIWIRDLFNRGASDLVFKNNTCYKKCHDEILAIFMGTIENVEITNNKFIMPESTDPSVMCFTIGSNSSKKADNIKFENNEIDCASVMDLFVLKNSSNVSIKNNNIKYTKQNSTSNNYLIYIPEGIVTDLDISENNIEINNNSKKELNAIMNSISSDVTFTKNKITVNSDMSEAFSGGIINKDNEITFNGNLHVIANKPRIFDNNKIILNGKTDMFFQYYNGKLEWESNITNNIFENNCDEIAEKQQSSILMFNGGTLNNYIVNFSNNTVKCKNPNFAEDRLYTLTLADETPQTIKILNNNIEGYKKEVKWENKAEHIIIKDNNEITVENTAFKGFNFEAQVPEEKKVTFERVLMQNKRQVEYGIKGAGSQWPVSLETSSTGDLMLYGIDVAGLYKSTDHGKNWTLACNGFGSRGIGMFAIDPHNSNHVLAVGLGDRKCGGIYVSYDKAETWAKYSSENNLPYHGARYVWDGLEFDSTSFDKDKNLTLDVYYSIPYKRDSEIRTSTETPSKSYTTLKENEVGLYKSIDGGKTFELIINDKKVADGIVRITENGNVYVGNQYGLFLIDKENNKIKASYLENDGEKEFSKGITGLDVVRNTIYAQTWDGIYTLNGEELTKITNENYKSENWPQFLTVSKSNPNHMIYQYRSIVTNYYVNNTAVSFDGGKTWKYGNANLNTTFYKSSWVGREKTYIIDPSNDNNVITFGSDTIMRSEDGGLNFVQASGVSNMMQGGKFNFNYYDSDLLLFSAQDYTGVISTDGGKTYSRINIPGKGNFYGGFAADRDTYFGFANTSWGGGTLSYTHDGGDTWTDTGLEATGVSECRHYSSLQSPTNPNALFAVEYYSKDKGYTWNKMNGCTSVFTYNYTGKKELYGGNADGKVVVSYDNGDTWKVVCDKTWNESSNVIKQTILDLAYDHVNNYIYAVVQLIIKGEGDAKYTTEAIYKLNVNTGELKRLNIPVDTDRGYMRQNSIAIDPNATSVIYVGGNGGYFSSATALLRSIDGGETWKILTSNNTEKYPSFNNNQGGYEVTNVRVNPYDGKVWIACGCYGYETFDPPYDVKKLSHEKPQEHTIKYVYNDKVVNEVKVRNNETHKYIYDEDGLTLVDWYTDKEFKNSFSNGSRVYNSMVLYAKMEESTKVEFYDGEKFLWKIDLDAYDLGDEKLIPTREGYAFAGWYKDSELSEIVDFDTIKNDTKVYAGWYKIVEDIFDIDAQDIGNYISYNDDHKIQDGKNVENNADVDDRCVYTSIDTNSTYYISFKMDTRCRIGLGKYAFWQYNPVKEYFIDEDDNNGKIPANKYVFKTISSGECDKLLVYYYTASGSKEYMDIKNTFKIYKIKNTNVKENINSAVDNTNIDIGREKLKIKDRKIVSASSGAEFKMKGMAVVNVFQGNNFRTEENIITSFKLLKDEGFNTIRYQLPSTMFYDYDTDTWNEENIEMLKNMCKIAEEIGIYVIVDMHTLKPSQVGFYDRTNHTYCMVSDKESEYTPGFIKIWTRLGKELVGYNSVLAYELMNEPLAMWETSQEMALENYRKIIQGCIDGIRENDKDTIISFQRIFNYIDTSYNWTTPTASFWPDIEGDNFLIDSYHSYDNMVFNPDMVYSNIAYGATQEYGTWHAEEYANIENSNYNTYSITIKAGDTAELLSSSAIRLENGVGTIVTTDNYKIYRINEDGTETEIISLSSTDDINKQNVYKYADTLGKEKQVNGEKYDFDLLHFLKIGLEPNEQIRISVDIKFENYSENTRMRWEYTTYKILPNEKGQDLVRGYDKLENTIIEYDEISKRYNSPIYWGEFCIKNQYINQYSDYIAYTDAFVELTEKYNLNWMWHHMSEYPADNGYGAYSKGDLPYPENKRPEMWNYIFPKLLALT